MSDAKLTKNAKHRKKEGRKDLRKKRKNSHKDLDDAAQGIF